MESKRPQLLFDLLRSAFDREALGHALLFVIDSRSESDAELKLAFRRFQALLMCADRKKGEGPCERCGSCKLLLTNTDSVQHPDFVQLDPTDKLHYSVEEVRSLIEGFSLTRSLAANRIAWIPQADLLSAGGQAGAANALLKLLEEPRPNSFLILMTSRPSGLLPTIRSRCQVFRLPVLNDPTDDGVEFDDLREDWGPLLDWIKSGAEAGSGPSLAADMDAFWKDREGALAQADRAYNWLWNQSRDAWAQHDLEQGRRILQLFSRFETCLAAIRGYGNAPLQWLSFRSDAKLDR